MSIEENYSIILLRTDGDHIILDVGNIENAYTKWATYRDEWSKSLQDKKPLIVVEKDLGIVTAFNPGIVYEIIIRKKDLRVSANNPYQKEMLEKGFSQTFGSHTKSGHDLLDRGYKI
jgi:hypothetical protein